VAREPEQQVVYIVDADVSVRQALSRLVRASGFEVRAFATIEELLAQMPRAAPGCILLDITTPSDRTAGLRAELHDRGIDLPLIALSARHDAVTRRWARAIGSEFFLGKPVDGQALLDAIEWVIDTKPDSTKRSWIADSPDQPHQRHLRHRRPR
jgi:FixJ family two-component response regulator